MQAFASRLLSPFPVLFAWISNCHSRGGFTSYPNPSAPALADNPRPMNPNHILPSRSRRLIVAQACLLLAACPFALGQAVTPNAATLAKYDKNHNGRLDADELAAMQADQKTTAT